MTKERCKHVAYLLTFLLISGMLMVFLYRFMVGEPMIDQVIWQSAQLVAEDGSTTPLDVNAYEVPDLGDGETLRFTAVLVRLPKNACLVFEPGDAEYTLALNGTEFYRSSSDLPDGAQMHAQQTRVALPPDGEGGTLELTFRPRAEWMWIYPPLLRITAPELIDRASYAYANHYGISGASFAVIFLVLLGLFLIQLTVGRRDWGGLCLTIASGLLAVHQLAIGLGYWFLPQTWNAYLCWEGLHVLAVVGMVVCLVLDRASWRMLAWATLWSTVVLLATCLISLPFGGRVARYTVGVLQEVGRGWFDTAIYWVTAYLVGICCAASCVRAVRSMMNIQSDTQALALKHDLAMDSYRVMEESARRTAELHHEMKNQITALRLMSEQGREDELRQTLEDMDQTHAKLTPVTFCKNFLFNAILQNTAARAAEEHVAFTASALVPEELNIGERDLCAYLMNLLDNALEGCRTVQPPTQPFIRFHAQVKNGFLAIHCENSYGKPLTLDGKGRPVTSKEDRQAHGFGLRQMEAVAKKYNSVLVVDHTPDVFSVQTALELPRD